MSKFINSLNRIQSHKDKPEHSGIGPEGSTPSGAGPERSEGTVPKDNLSGNTIGPHGAQKLLGIVFTTCAILLLLNIAFFLLTKNYSERTNEALARLSAIEAALSKNAEDSDNTSLTLRQMKIDIDKLNAKISSLNSGYTELKESSQGQLFLIETLNKAKNTLFNRLNELELKLDQVKTINQAQSSKK